MNDTKTPPIETVMLVDDEEVDQMLYGRIIERSPHAGRILSFLDAKRALSHLVDQDAPKPDLVLLDINMPGFDGFEFLDTLSNTMAATDVPFIAMLTTSFNPKDESRARASPLVSAYKNKPLTDGMLAEFRDAISLGDRHTN